MNYEPLLKRERLIFKLSNAVFFFFFGGGKLIVIKLIMFTSSILLYNIIFIFQKPRRNFIEFHSRNSNFCFTNGGGA